MRYLGDIISASGARRPCIEDRRNTGWARVSEITAILTAIPSNIKIQVGLKLREAKLLNGILYSTEAWNNTTDKEWERLEQVDMAAFRALIGGGHSKCPKAFYSLEFGTLMIRHVVMIKILIYHHHIITRDDSEFIKKVYMKQKENPLKGDWVQLIQKDFEFIEEDWNDFHIRSIPKDIYIKNIKEKVQRAAFKNYLSLREASKTKMKPLIYEEFQMQKYLTSNQFNREEVKLLYSLRSKCYPSKANFKNMNKGNLKCIFLCDQVETQEHVFQHCEPVLRRLKLTHTEQIKSIYGSPLEQKSAIQIFVKIDQMRKFMIDNLLPGETNARTQDNIIPNHL